jgi:hypothetical protein
MFPGAKEMADKMDGADDGAEDGGNGASHGEALVKEFFEKGEAGDYAAAWDALKSACELSDEDDGDEGEAPHALVMIGHKEKK